MLIVAIVAVPVAAQEPAPTPPTLEQAMLLRCSAAFAVVAGEQQRGVPRAQAYPALAERGREFFVRAGARLMDERKLSREQIEAAVRTEATALQDGAARASDPDKYLDDVMRPCLVVLDASGL